MQNQDGIVAPDRVTTIRHVDMNRGVEWITGGFKLFMKKPAEWLIAGLALLAASFVLTLIPILGGGLKMLLGVVAVGALMRACQALEDAQDPVMAAQKAASITPLWILGLIGAGLAVGVGLLSALVIATMIGGFLLGPVAGIGVAAIGYIMLLLLSIPLLMALWLAPGLVVLKGTHPVEAVRLSFLASIKNFVPFIIFYILGAIASYLGSLPFGLGLIFVYPVMICATYLAYKDIFATAASGEAVGYIQETP